MLLGLLLCALFPDFSALSDKPSVPSVSYTHLDVYKRQTVDVLFIHMGGNKELVLPASELQSKLIPQLVRVLWCDFTRLKAVSYTHLDVYKRQGLYAPNRRITNPI